MSVDEFTDQQGVKWVGPARAAEIWNERAKEEYGVEANYTRWSLRSRRDDLETMETPLGFLYKEAVIRAAPLRPTSRKRPDVADKNKSRTKRNYGHLEEPIEAPPLESPPKEEAALSAASKE